MADPRDRLQRMWDASNRFANFGEVIQSVQIHGIRCHHKSHIEIQSPVTAFSGLNGTGKSTVLQLAACAYDPPYICNNRVSRFIVATELDPSPFVRGSKVQFSFLNQDGSTKPLTLSYYGSWNGYNRRIRRDHFFGGIGTYLPTCESPSFQSKAKSLRVAEAKTVAARISQWTCRILGQSYDCIAANSTNITVRRVSKNVSSVLRGGLKYSEANMGFGEARTIHLITTLETLADKSLVLIEEPETSLHLSAQHEFGRYLVDVCIAKKHQILLTTHSEFILQALPSASSIFLSRQGDSIRPIPGLTPLQARSFMADGHVKALKVLVEDETAKAVLTEIVRRHDPKLLTSVGFYIGGDKDRIANTVRGLEGTGIPIAAVRDADKEGSPKENIFKLPGAQAPEKEVFNSAAFRQHVLDSYGLRMDDFAASLQGVDHHRWFELLAERIQKAESALIWEAARIYVHGLAESDTATLVMLLKEASLQKFQ